MGKKANLSGVQAKGPDRIQFDFKFKGVRYRPTLERIPNERNLRRAHEQLKEMKARIKRGTFVFGDEFPDYRYRGEMPEQEETREKTCSEVLDGFLSHCEMRVSMDDMAFSTLHGYRNILEAVWRPVLGSLSFEKIVYSQLARIAAERTNNKKTYNNIVSAVRAAFSFGYKDHPHKFNPAVGLRTLRITRKDRPPVDPFPLQQAEEIIAISHRMFGELHGNYEEFRFFTGLRQSEQFALQVTDYDAAEGIIKIDKACVLGRDKNRTKTNQGRVIELCPRALQVLDRQLALREELIAAGRINHSFVFFWDVDFEPIRDVSLPYKRWRQVMHTLPAIRYRPPYNCRHSYISWRLMIGHNRLLVAQDDGHSVSMMERTYAAWTKGTKPEELARIELALAGRHPVAADASHSEDVSPGRDICGRRSERRFVPD